MKTLYLVRHADAVDTSVGVVDFDRWLSERGRGQACAVAEQLANELSRPDAIVSSPAARAVETARTFAQALGHNPDQILLKDGLYTVMKPMSLVRIIRQLDDTFATVMMFGHNPSLSDLAAVLVDGYRQQLAKVGVLGIQFDAERWNAVSARSGEVCLDFAPARV